MKNLVTFMRLRQEMCHGYVTGVARRLRIEATKLLGRGGTPKLGAMSVMLLGVACITYAASAQPGYSQNKAPGKSGPKILPWIEINIPHYTMEKWWPRAARTRPGVKFID